ncbi:inosine/xanthosine triphosphatase [Melioribacteraceae bacterium 4301-Me]|uniref:inosine/xanthosine triphosphatase n=1 Tax=Pyranulibacter aquaticus TaxID=3163344 RepID=UPI003594F3CF
MKVLVGSKNPVKINSAHEAFSKFFHNVEVTGIEVNSGVPQQPINEETFKGARNRALELIKINAEENLKGEYFVGIEGGIIKQFNKWFAFGGMCIIDNNGNEGFGTSPLFELPEFIIEKLLNGAELGEVMDEITNIRNTKQNTGAIGFFTNGVMHRKDLYVPGLIAALIPFLHKNFFRERKKDKLQGET